MICFDRGENRFNFRVAGVVINNGKILLHKTVEDDFWALPGGRNELLEYTKDTLIREMKEELDEEIIIDRLLWVVENFFEFDNKNYHEISFCYLMKFNEKSLILNKRESFLGVEEDVKLIFEWFDIKDIDDIVVYPTFIKEKIKALSNNIEHIMHIGE